MIDAPEAALQIRGMFEIGPTDNFIPELIATPDDTRWALLIPGCDMDVVRYDGWNVFNRLQARIESAPLLKSAFVVYGANHNFYNTAWTRSDSHPVGCVNQERLFDDPERQRDSARLGVISFFAANVGDQRDPSLNEVFDPSQPLELDYRVSRIFHPGGGPTEALPLADFPNGDPGTQQVGPGVSVLMGVLSSSGPLGLAMLDFETPGTPTFFQTSFSAADVRAYDFLDFRVDMHGDYDLNDFTPRSLGVALVDAAGATSNVVAAEDYLEIVPLPRGFEMHPTARIPFEDFDGVDLSAVAGVRFLFDDPKLPGVELAAIRATRDTSGL